MAEIIKQIAAFSEDAIDQAFARVDIDKTQISTLLQPLADVLGPQPKPKKKALKRPHMLSDEEIFSQRIIPLIEEKLLDYEQASLTQEPSWSLDFNYRTDFQTMTIPEMKRSHAEIIEREKTIEGMDLLLKFHRGFLYLITYSKKPSNQTARAWFKTTFGVPYSTALRYITVASLITKWPILLMCGLSYAQLLKHNKRLQAHLSKDDDLSARLGQTIEITAQDKSIKIGAKDVQIPFIEQSTDPDVAFHEKAASNENATAADSEYEEWMDTIPQDDSEDDLEAGVVQSMDVLSLTPQHVRRKDQIPPGLVGTSPSRREPTRDQNLPRLVKKTHHRRYESTKDQKPYVCNN